ncbi:glycolipid transfer protein domain-containing protein [Pelagophyceae sp. CCMP2097]|nr:glycolipid transfer protein domain-containing protein [Pelagophyceae sp. CCMP2097]
MDLPIGEEGLYVHLSGSVVRELEDLIDDEFSGTKRQKPSDVVKMKRHAATRRGPLRRAAARVRAVCVAATDGASHGAVRLACLVGGALKGWWQRKQRATILLFVVALLAIGLPLDGGRRRTKDAVVEEQQPAQSLFDFGRTVAFKNDAWPMLPLDGAWYDLRYYQPQGIDTAAKAPALVSSKWAAGWRRRESAKHPSRAIEGLKASERAFRRVTPTRRQRLRLGDHGLQADVFLTGVAALMPTFGAFGSAIHAAAVKDVTGNIRKLERNGALTAPLMRLVRDEVARGTARHPDSSAQALIWLKRILQFTSTFFVNLLKDPKRPLTRCLIASYEVELGPHHNAIMRHVAMWLMQIIPDRTAMFTAFEVASFDDLRPHLESWIQGVAPLIAYVNDFYDELDQDI